MNKHLKPGVAVDVRGASDEDVQAVIDACARLGLNMAKLDSGKGFVVLTASAGDFFECHLSCGLPIISINQAIVRESEVEKAWFERGELPPVGTKVKLRCPEFDRDHDFEFNGAEAEILLHRTTDNGNKVAVFVSEHGDYHALVAHCFRPLKTEKEKFVDNLYSEWQKMRQPHLKAVFGELYESGYRKTE